MIKAIIFDFDGTIIDTETAWYVAFQEAYRAHGVDLTVETYAQCIGTSLHSFNPYDYLVTHLHMDVDLDALREWVQRRHTELMEAEQMRPGIRHFLDSAKDSGLRIGLASSSSERWVRKFLKQLDIEGYFECMRTADHVKKVKPDPELYVQALECLSVKPEEAIAVEDSPNGSKAAVLAGLKCVVAPNRITRLLPFEKVHRMADSLDEIDFHSLLSEEQELIR